MPRSIEETAQWIADIAADPARLRAEAAKIQPTPFTEAVSNCAFPDEKIVLFVKCFGVDALGAWIRLHRWDQATLRQAAADLDRNGMADLAAEVRVIIPSIKAKVSDALAAKRAADRASKRAFRKVMAKARRS
jgi:hypothetical protein